MVTNELRAIVEPYGFAWYVAESGHEWRDDVVSIVGGSKNSSSYLVERDAVFSAKRRRYNPLKKPGLFQRFARLDPSQSAIQRFADEWGLLAATMVAGESGGQLPEVGRYGVRFDVWDFHIRLMRTLIEVRDECRNVKSGATDQCLRQYAEWRGNRVIVVLRDRDGMYFGGRTYDSTHPNYQGWTQNKSNLLFGPVFQHLCDRLNEELNGEVSPVLIARGNGTPLFAPNNLLAAMYLQLGLSLPSEPMPPRFCEICGSQLDLRARIDTKTCGDNCRQALKRRNDRNKRAYLY